jgi:hypothetical protein
VAHFGFVSKGTADKAGVRPTVEREARSGGSVSLSATLQNVSAAERDQQPDVIPHPEEAIGAPSNTIIKGKVG